MEMTNAISKHRKWMRGLAVFFISIGAFGVIALSLIMLFVPNDTVAFETIVFPLISSAVILITGIMAWHSSRLAIVALLLFILSSFLDVGTMTTGRIALMSVYLVLAIMLLWHAHRYHTASKREESPIGGRAWVRWSGIAIMTPLALTLIVNMFGYVGMVSTKVQAAQDIPYKHLAWMYENELLEDDERVLFFYSEGIFSIEEGGNVLTNKYVGAWYQDEGEVTDYWQRLGEICTIETIAEGSPSEDAFYKITGPDEDSWFNMVLSVEDDGHKAFLRRMNVMNERRMHPFVKQACESGEPLDRDKLALANGIQPGLVGPELVTETQIDWLRSQGYLTSDETIAQFYSYGEYDIAAGGAMLTDKYFGGWYEKGGSTYANWAKLGEICALDRHDQSDDSDTPLFMLTYGEEEWYRFELPVDASDSFVPSVLEKNASLQTDESKTACEIRLSSGKTDEA